MKISELTRLAFIYAEQDRRAYADCWPEGSPERKAADTEADIFKKYRLKRWGRTHLEAVLDTVQPRKLAKKNDGDKQTEGWANVLRPERKNEDQLPLQQ